MAKTEKQTLTASEGRQFGLTVGGAFVVIAAITWFRGHDLSAIVIGGVGAALGIAGLVLPARLGYVQSSWMSLAHAISKVTTPIILGAMYLLVLFPIGLVRRRLGRNPLVHQPEAGGFWKTREKPAGSMRRQF